VHQIRFQLLGDLTAGLTGTTGEGRKGEGMVALTQIPASALHQMWGKVYKGREDVELCLTDVVWIALSSFKF